MSKKSVAPGKNTLKPEVVGITPHGIWINVRGIEYFAAFKDFPWFKNSKVSDIYLVNEPVAGHLYWPNIDIDLHIDSLENPNAFPLIAKSGSAKRGKKRPA